MGSAGSPGRPGPAGPYLSGLGASGLGLCAAGWLVLTPFAFGYRGRSYNAALTDLATGGALAAVCLVTLAAWSVGWRRALRADGVLAARPRARARAVRRADGDGAEGPAPDPDQVLTALRALLAQPAVAPGPVPADAPPAGSAGPAPADAAPAGSVIPEPRNGAEPANGIAVIESMTARAEPLMPGYEDEETW
jgi:hypothetical protein